VADLTAAGLLGGVDPGWARALAPVTDVLAGLAAFLVAEDRAGHRVLPERSDIMRAFRRPFSQVRVLVVGQDPYPNPAHPIGLSFAVEREVRPVPPSLRNIYAELRDDLGIEPPPHGDLSAWADRGVMLLNRVLTVRPGDSNSHQGKGWEAITEQAIVALAERRGPCVAILWGSPAQKLKPLLGPIPWVASTHPSPLSAHRGFLGSKPFSQTNRLLEEQGADPVDWTLPEYN
jgi:uracil-DNA glycosylase